MISELTVGVCVPSETVTVRRYFGGGRLAGAVEVGDEILGKIVADAVVDRRDFDRAQILDKARMRRLAVERLEAAGQTAGERKRRADGETSRPRH